MPPPSVTENAEYKAITGPGASILQEIFSKSPGQWSENSCGRHCPWWPLRRDRRLIGSLMLLSYNSAQSAPRMYPCNELLTSIEAEHCLWKSRFCQCIRPDALPPTLPWDWFRVCQIYGWLSRNCTYLCYAQSNLEDETGICELFQSSRRCGEKSFPPDAWIYSQPKTKCKVAKLRPLRAALRWHFRQCITKIGAQTKCQKDLFLRPMSLHLLGTLIPWRLAHISVRTPRTWPMMIKTHGLCDLDF